jgi:spermidine synthase
VRTLHVGGEAIQSSMRLEDPYALALDYTRCMMAFLLFHPEPHEVLMIGLGGGSLAKFFFRNLRKTRTKVVELDARVVAAAREHFALPPDGERLSVEVGDGAEALEPEC